jgi:hypothetical protein
MVSTPVRRSTRGVPLVAPSSAQYAHANSSTYSWLEPAPSPKDADQDDDNEPKRYFKSFMRVSQVKAGKGNKRSTKTSGEPAIEQLKFSIGDGVLVACHGNSIGVGVLTRLWEELREIENDGDVSEDEDEEEEHSRQEWKKQCEIRWCYRRQDLPTTMNQMRLLDVSSLLHVKRSLMNSNHPNISTNSYMQPPLQNPSHRSSHWKVSSTLARSSHPRSLHRSTLHSIRHGLLDGRSPQTLFPIMGKVMKEPKTTKMSFS